MTVAPASGRRTADEALRFHGWSGERLMKLAHAIANDYLRRKGAVLGDRYEDFVSVLWEAGCKAAIEYDPARSGPGYTFGSFLWDKMELAIEPDFFRRKREGFGDRRYGLDGLVTVSSEAADVGSDPLVEFDVLLEAARLRRWQRMFDEIGVPLSEFMVELMDALAQYGRLRKFHLAAIEADLTLPDFMARALHRECRRVA